MTPSQVENQFKIDALKSKANKRVMILRDTTKAKPTEKEDRRNTEIRSKVTRDHFLTINIQPFHGGPSRLSPFYDYR